MSLYQTFPDRPGDSNSQAKLASLALPPLTGKTFLDLGCNEGYFCGYAFFDGARQVLGLDINPEFIGRARERFPQCQFEAVDWANLATVLDPARKFDVILCVSALHYAANQAELVRGLVDRLSPNGVLVLEVSLVAPGSPGICGEEGNGWYWVRRSIDRRLFATWEAMLEMLSPYAYKYMGPGVNQKGDPLGRFVFHVRKALPVAILLMGAPGSGKSTVARKLSGKIKVVSGDVLLGSLTSLSPEYPLLRKIGGEGVPWNNIGAVVKKFFESPAWLEYVELVANTGANEDFLFDGYIPESEQNRFATAMEKYGYQVLRLFTPEPAISPDELSRRGRVEARKYQLFLTAYTAMRKPRGRL